MPTNSDFSKMSKSQLNRYLARYTLPQEEYDRIVSELDKKEQIEKDERNNQFSRTIFWSRLAGIAAIVGILVPFLPIPHCTYRNNDAPSRIEQNIQGLKQDNQQPTKNTVSSSSSNTDWESSINSKKTSTYDSPSQKRK